VCSGNAHRSPLAEALLKKMRPDLEVDSAGLHVAIPISTEVRNYLAKQNAEEYLKSTPETLAEKNLESYDIIVAMEQRNVEDPYFMAHDDAQRIYRKIEQKAEELAESLQGFP
jgi:protein-tyrosine-phosphatase